MGGGGWAWMGKRGKAVSPTVLKVSDTTIVQ